MVDLRGSPHSIGVCFRHVAAEIWQSSTIEYWRAERPNGRRYYVTSEDRSLGLTLALIVAERRQAAAEGHPVQALIGFRQQYRQIIKRGRIAALFTCLESNDRELTRLAIWLISRMRSKAAIAEILPHSRKTDLRMRREVARALSRLGAWAELRTMSQFDTDPRVQRIAAGQPARLFADRWRRFADDAEVSNTRAEDTRHAPLYFREPIGPGRAPRAPELIRAILERIRQLVRGL